MTVENRHRFPRFCSSLLQTALLGAVFFIPLKVWANPFLHELEERRRELQSQADVALNMVIWGDKCSREAAKDLQAAKKAITIAHIAVVQARLFFKPDGLSEAARAFFKEAQSRLDRIYAHEEQLDLVAETLVQEMSALKGSAESTKDASRQASALVSGLSSSFSDRILEPALLREEIQSSSPYGEFISHEEAVVLGSSSTLEAFKRVDISKETIEKLLAKIVRTRDLVLAQIRSFERELKKYQIKPRE
ncbi:MAG: hypothetical protein KA436_02640 [Oligoflexales bacterium]|nr:hypothetical protein [Oligoflexales bacterium]